MEVYKSTQKPKLTSSPFTSFFHYGANQDGYWNYNTMVLQFEDVVNFLTCLFGNKYEYIFYFDHSSGHDRNRPDGLNANELNKYFGGKQTKMRKSEIKNVSYLGTFDHADKLIVGQTQSMIFEPGDAGPFYYSNDEKERRKNDIETNEEVRKKYSRAFLIDKIKEKTGLQQVQGTLKEVQESATKLNIPIDFTTKKILEGWAGKPKGMLQILWERGFLDPSKSPKELMIQYNSDFKKDRDTKKPIPGTSLRHIVSNLPDFKQEITLLQFRAKQLGVTIDCSPKFHPEIAGEGIEFCWGLSKNQYIRFSIEEKRTKCKYLELVKKCTCSETIITKKMVRLFGGRMRRYMLAYLALEKAKAAQSDADNMNTDTESVANLPEMSSSLVEKIMKVYKQLHKAHRNIADTEKGFLKSAAAIMRSQN